MRNIEERSFTTHDGVNLFYRYWPAAGAAEGAPKRAVVMFHRGHEHSGRMAHVVDELGLNDFAFFAWDARGHGRSPGERGYSPSFGTSVRDVQTFIDHIVAYHGVAVENIAVLAQSVGAVLVSTWAHDYAPRVRCLVLASPAFKVKLYVPFARTGIKFMQKLRGQFFVNSYVKAKFLTHDPERIASYDTDPLITRPIASHILLALYEAAERVVADAQAITIPTQMLVSGADFVVHRKPQEDFFQNLGSSVKELHELPGFYHDTLGEKDRALAIAKARDFILRMFDAPPARTSLLDADKHGYTHDEAARLAQPAEGAAALYWAATRAGLKFGGMVSEGVKLGFETGFDSGSTLDYVYRNEARGTPLIGTAIDRNYLDAVGWAGIRQRKLNVEELLRIAIRNLRAHEMPVHMLDIAAGHGRYVLEAIEKAMQGDGDASLKPDSILLRDYSEINVRDGARLISDKGLGSIARFIQADAFDAASIAATEPAPTIGIVSGLYELFPDNDMIRRSLAGMAEAVQPGGYLVYTGQPWHPQLEFIARALTSHRGGQAWVMRRRTQAEMDQLVEAAGFRKIEQRIDEWGIFTVSLAQRIG